MQEQPSQSPDSSTETTDSIVTSEAPPPKHSKLHSLTAFIQPHSTVARALVVMIAFGLLGSLLLYASHAATYYIAAEAETGSLSGGATVITDTTASGGKAVTLGTSNTSGGGGGSTNAKPSASNTGVPAGTSLKVVNGDQTVTTANTVISGEDIHGYLTIKASNVTVKNSIVRGGAVKCNSAVIWVQSGSATLEDSEIIPTNPNACLDGIWATNTTILRMNIHGTTDGIKAYNNTTVKNSYVHNLAYNANDPNQGGGNTHNDAIQTYECNSNILVQYNNLDLSSSSNMNAAYQITQDSGKACSNIVIDHNWVDGGGCTINVAHKVLSSLSGVSLTNNRFGHHQQYSGCTVLLSTQSHLTAYSGNVWDDTGQAIPSPQVHD